MTDTDDSRPAPRTYGGWRKRRPMGLFGLGPAGTVVLLCAALVVLGSLTLSPRLGMYVAPPVAAGAGISLIRIGGMPVVTWVAIRVRWHTASARNWTSYRAGTVSPLPGSVRMPGVLAGTMLVDSEDGRGGHYGLVWDRHAGYLTATIQVTPASPWLASQDETDAWVAGWGQWLAGLGHVPSVRWVSVTTESAPEPGTRLSDATAASLSDEAPEAARQIMTAVTMAAPQAAASVSTRISVTFDPKRDPSKPDNLPDAAAAVTRTLHGLMPGLGACGVAVDGLATAEEIAGIVRAAYDPERRGEIARILKGKRDSAPPLTWSAAGPVGLDEYTGHLVADSGVSVSFMMDEAPRQPVTSHVLAQIVSPQHECVKRVTIQYRVLPAAEAARTIESEVSAAGFRAEFKARTGRDATARDTADAARAMQAAREEAAGAGMVLLSLYATLTVPNDDDCKSRLARVTAAFEAAADGALIQVRRAWGSQSAVFAAGLPAGICPPEMSARRLR